MFSIICNLRSEASRLSKMFIANYLCMDKTHNVWYCSIISDSTKVSECSSLSFRPKNESFVVEKSVKWFYLFAGAHCTPLQNIVRLQRYTFFENLFTVISTDSECNERKWRNPLIVRYNETIWVSNLQRYDFVDYK